MQSEEIKCKYFALDPKLQEMLKPAHRKQGKPRELNHRHPNAQLLARKGHGNTSQKHTRKNNVDTERRNFALYIALVALGRIHHRPNKFPK
jgi:hypothetical protein